MHKQTSLSLRYSAEDLVLQINSKNVLFVSTEYVNLSKFDVYRSVHRDILL